MHHNVVPTTNWVALRFAEEQQLKDVEETHNSTRDYHRPYQVVSDDDSSDNNRYQVYHKARPGGALRGGGNKYHADRYYREYDECMSMKFGEEIGSRCHQKLEGQVALIEKLSAELRRLSTLARYTRLKFLLCRYLII
jgi:hypothetical protein